MIFSESDPCLVGKLQSRLRIQQEESVLTKLRCSSSSVHFLGN